MKIVVLYRPKSDKASEVEEYINELRKDVQGTGVRIEVLNVDSRDGNAMASLYDVFSFPTILVVQDSGIIQHSWEGQELPLFDEIKAYALA
jgi:hypothetical protein